MQAKEPQEQSAQDAPSTPVPNDIDMDGYMASTQADGDALFRMERENMENSCVTNNRGLR